MILTLEILGERAEALEGASRKVFRSMGGTIGRLPDNDWVFPDPYVSGRHALIRYLNGEYYIEDTSTNGVAINSPENSISRIAPHPLRHGDVLYVDAYEIGVSIEPAAVQEEDPFKRLWQGPSRGEPSASVWAQMIPSCNSRSSIFRRRTFWQPQRRPKAMPASRLSRVPQTAIHKGSRRTRRRAPSRRTVMHRENLRRTPPASRGRGLCVIRHGQ